MLRRPAQIPLETLAGAAAWAVAGLPLLLDIIAGATFLTEPRTVIAMVAWLAFGALFLAVASGALAHHPYAVHRRLLALQTAAAALAVAAFPQHGVTAILLILTAVVAAHVLPHRSALALVVAQGAFLTGAVATVAWPDLTIVVLQGLGYTAFMLFAYLTTRSGLQEAHARAELARRNAELRATRSLLAKHQRAAERLRIARDLHDGVGHHLTALILNLEIALRAEGAAARAATERAEELARSLLQEVRDTVRAVRDHDAVDVAEALRTLIADLPEPEVTLDLPVEIRIADPEAAHALLRCAQEAITNVVRHADARRLHLAVARKGDSAELTARDDGRGTGTLPLDEHGAPLPGASGSGSGLVGLRERLEAVGGSLHLASKPAHGFTLRATVPAGRVEGRAG